MKKGLILLVIAAAAAAIFISGCVATVQKTPPQRQETASHRDIKGKTISIKAGSRFRYCDRWESGDKINIAFSSSEPVRYSSYYRQKRSTDTIYITNDSLSDWYEGSIAVQGDEEYCVTWHNDNFQNITLTYHIEVGK